jgi:hypothetical protein
MSVIKLVDGSHKLGRKSSSVIDTKEELFKIIKEHLEGLFEHKQDDEKIFWATYSVYVIKKDKICLCSRMGTCHPIYDVEVEKAGETEIRVEPYKIDGYKEYTVGKLEVTSKPEEGKREKYKMISPLEVMGWEEDLEQKWKGRIWVRTNFTGWNIIRVKVNREKLAEEKIL